MESHVCLSIFFPSLDEFYLMLVVKRTWQGSFQNNNSVDKIFWKTLPHNPSRYFHESVCSNEFIFQHMFSFIPSTFECIKTFVFQGSPKVTRAPTTPTEPSKFQQTMLCLHVKFDDIHYSLTCVRMNFILKHVFN